MGSLVPTGNIQINIAGETHGTITPITVSTNGDFSHSIDSSSFAVGPYQITYSYLGDSNFNALSDNTKVLTVINSNATISLSNLSRTYDGQPKPVAYTTNPPGLTASISYDGTSTAPTDAGSYIIAASITSVGYTGTANDTLNIAKVSPVFTNLSSPTINQGAASAVLGGNLQSSSLIPTGTISITLNGLILSAPINAATGDFSSIFDTSTLNSSTSPYPITYHFVGDANFNAVSDSAFSLIVTPGNSPTPSPTPTPTPQPSGGGGGGGGGGAAASILPSGFAANTALEINSSGFILSDAKLTTKDGKATLNIAYKTKLLSNLGNPLSLLTVVDATSTPVPPVNNALLCAYTFGPDGAKFDPPINLTLRFDPGTLPEGIQEDTLFVAYWDGSQWISLESNVDTSTHTVSAPLSHFSTYSLLGKFVTPTSTPAPAPIPASTPADEVIPSPAIDPAVLPETTTTAPVIPEIIQPESTTEKGPTSAPAQTPPFSTLIIIWVVIFVAATLLTLLFVSKYRRRSL